MNETQKRIAVYKEALPHMKERVMAVATLLVISVVMVASATFAWITLSSNPEASSLTTTISANGNLEIALSPISGDSAEISSDIGDTNKQWNSTYNDNGELVTLGKNNTWGNLVNLSHESYGLDYLTLRPASLNTAALSVSPLFAVNYGQDGRVEGYLTDFSFSNFNADAKVFDVFDTTRYGVRAISSVEFSNAHAASFYTKQLEKITGSMADAKTKFDNIYGNASYMNTVTALVSVHVNVTLNGGDISCLVYMENLEKMVGEFNECADLVGQTMVDIANLYLYDDLSEKGQVGLYATQAFELEDLKANNFSNDLIKNYSGLIKGLPDYVALAQSVEKVNTGMANARKNADGDVLWKRDLQSVANLLCNMSTARLGGLTVSEVSQLAQSNPLKLTSFLSDTKDAVIYNGLLKDMDQMLGEPTMYVPNVKIAASYKGINLDIKANILTDAKAPFVLPATYNDAYIFSTTASEGDRGTPVAADTYAMAIDFWVRTNEKDALLMLEGEIVYEETPVYGYDADNNRVELYQYTKTVTQEDESEEVTVELYKKEDQTTHAVTWYHASTHEVEDIGNAQPTKKTVKTPAGYEGVNRVWDELDDTNSDAYQNLFGKTSITQGSGSCYIFYPEGPEDQEQSLHLLKAMSVAFVAEDGEMLGQAEMDTENAIENGGRVIVPLKMRKQTTDIVVGKDEEDNDIVESFYVTSLKQNEPKRVTAVIYLDGKNLTNSDVLAAGTINGQLNIQFGLNKAEMNPIENPDLQKEGYEIQIGIVNPEKAADDVDRLVKSMTFDSYDQNDCKVNLELALIGMTASTVKGQFVSYINASQGAREQTFNMVYDETTKLWKATAPFSGPGNFKLRSIQIDGVDIKLPEEQILTVYIDGIKISMLTYSDWSGNTKNHMTADTSYKQELYLLLNSGEETFHKIQGVFMGDNNKNVTVTFTPQDKSNYYGTANFTSGGTYELTYVIIDGAYTPLDESMYKILELKLNLKTTVILGQPVDLTYDALRAEMEEALEAAGSNEEKEQIQAEYRAKLEDHLDLLYNGNGIEGDPNEKGLELKRDSKGNLNFVTDCLEPLFIDVRCIITDDQGNHLKNLTDMELVYRAGGVSNQMDPDMLEDEDASYYAGRFVLESNGVFRFYQVSFKDENGKEHTITSATSAPTITAIQPQPLEYINQPAYAPVTYNLGMPASQRVLYIKLKNAAAAQLDVTLVNGENKEVHADNVEVVGTDANNVTTFAVPVSDGYWGIKKVLAKSVFYDGKFYTGEEEDLTTWLDLTQWVQEDEIDTAYITEATVKVEGGVPKQDYSGQFMTSNPVEGMKVSVLGYNDIPLEKVLKDNGIDAEVSVDLKYTLDMQSFTDKYSTSGSGTLPQNAFGVQTADEYGNITMENMNFLLPGDYYPTWKVTIDAVDDAYDFIPEDYYVAGGGRPSIFRYVNTEPMHRATTVSWEAPDVQVTAADNTSTAFAVNLNGDGSSLAYLPLEGVKNYIEPYYANVYIATNSDKEHTIPTVTMTMSKLGLAETASFVVPNAGNSSHNRTFSFSKTDLEDTQSIGGKSGTNLFNWVSDRYYAGKQTITAIDMVYDNLTYKVPLFHSIVVNNQMKPIYLAFSVPSDKVTAPSTVISPDGRPMTVTLKDLGQWTEVVTETQTLEETVVGGNADGTLVGTYYYRTGAGWFLSPYRYHTVEKYERTVVRGTEDTTTTTTYALNYWTVNGTNKNAGSQVTITEGQTATAVEKIVTSSVKKTPHTDEIKQTKYVVTKSNQSSAPSGTGGQIDQPTTGQWIDS